MSLAKFDRLLQKYHQSHGQKVYCLTCGKVFLECPMNYFLLRHSKDQNVLDQWFVAVSLHWLETDMLHQIACFIDGNYVYNFSEQLDMQRMNLGSFSKEQLAEALKGLTQTANKKI